MEIPPQISKKRLIDFSKEHLYYEIDMLYGSVKTLVDGVENPYIYNALLEAFVLHTSIILDFFYKPQIKRDDARAIHYISDRKSWAGALPPYDRHFRKFSQKRNKDVAHLSYKRLDVPQEGRSWGAVKIVKEIQKIVDTFLDKADPKLIHPRLYELRSK